MKIIAEGAWKNPWTHEYTCREKECGAKLLVEEADVKAPDYANHDHFNFECAVCGHSNPLPATDLPLRIKKILNAKRKVRYSDD